MPSKGGTAPFVEDLEVLLVEDERVARQELVRILARQGFHVRQAASSRSALTKAGSGKVGLVLMDLLLGGSPEGIDTAQRLQLAYPWISIVFVSAYASDPHLRLKAQQSLSRIGGWIEKPIQPSMADFLDVVSRELKKAALRKRLSNESWRGLSVELLLEEFSGEVEEPIIDEVRAELGINLKADKP